MLSPETDKPEPVTPRKKLHLGWRILIGVVIATPLFLTMMGRVTAPPHAIAPPVGHLIYLDADQPSERTTMMRGLYTVGTDGQSQLLLHETEPQDTDAGNREWITQPAASPDGQSVAFITQIYTLQQEHRTVTSTIWIKSRNPKVNPLQIADLSKMKSSQNIIGLAWTPDSKSVVFLSEDDVFTISAVTGQVISRRQLRGMPALETSTKTKGISATRSPRLLANGALSYVAITPSGSVLVIGNKQYPVSGPAAVSKDGREFAVASSGHSLEVRDAGTGAVIKKYTARWGWSPLARKLTHLCFSPDGQYLAYSVSKMPWPEDDLFFLDTRNGDVRQLEEHAGQAAWDWGP